MQNEKINNILQRLKHMRGRHDQRTHNRWPSGYIAQSSDTSPALGEPVQRRDILKRQQQQGSSSLVLANENQENRDAIRLPRDVSASSLNYTDVGQTSVIRKFSYNNRTYYKREEPNSIPPEVFPISSHLLPVLADIISTGMGVDAAPVAQIMSDGKIVTTGMDVADTSKKGMDMNSVFTSIPSSKEDFENIEDSLEAIALLDALIGQADGHMMNYVPVRNNAVNSDYPMVAGIDFDIAGTFGEINSAALFRYLGLRCDNKYAKYRTDNDGLVIRKSGVELLKKLKNNIKWTDDINQATRNILMARIDTLINFAESYTTNKNLGANAAQKNMERRLDYYSAEAGDASNASMISDAISDMYDDYRTSINLTIKIDNILGTARTGVLWMDNNDERANPKSFNYLNAINEMLASYYNGIPIRGHGHGLMRQFITAPLKRMYYEFANRLSKADSPEEVQKIKEEYQKEKEALYRNAKIPNDMNVHGNKMLSIVSSLIEFVTENADLIENYEKDTSGMTVENYEKYRQMVYPYIKLLEKISKAQKNSDARAFDKIMKELYEYAKSNGSMTYSNPSRGQFLPVNESVWNSVFSDIKI